MLVPLTASLYVPGTLDDAEKVLVDIGTGFFAEVSIFILFLTISPDFLLYCWTLNPSSCFSLI